MRVTRLQALSERFFILVTVWPSAAHRDLDTWAIRLTNGAFHGGVLEVTDARGRSLPYQPVIPAGREFTQMFSTAIQSQRFQSPWLWDHIDPINLDLRSGVGEVARIWTTSGQATLQQWHQREVLFSGGVTGWKWGSDRQNFSFTIAQKPLREKGQLWPVGAEFDSDRFGDIGNSGDYDIAPEAAGQLPPYIYAPVGSGMYAPVIPVVDQVDAASPVSIKPTRYLLGARRPASSGSAHQFRFRDPVRKGRWMAGDTSAEFQASPLLGTDDLGDPYWHVRPTFHQSVGVNDFVFTNGSPTVTTSLKTHKIQEGDQIRADGDGDDDFAVVSQIDDTSYTLDRNYTGTSSPPGGEPCDVIRNPEQKAYPGYRICTLGGDDSADGSGPISDAMDVAIDILGRSNLGVPIALGDLRALRNRFGGIQISTIINKRVPPFPWVRDKILAMLPIRPYLDSGVLRFRWVGPVDEAEIRTTIDLDALGPAYRLEPISYGAREVYPQVRLRYAWDLSKTKPRFTRVIVQDGSRETRAAAADLTGWVPTARAVEAWGRYRSPQKGMVGRDIPVYETGTDVIELRTGAGLISTWLLYLSGIERQTVQLEHDRSLAWLELGDVIRVKQSGTTWPSQIWRVEMRSFKGTGQGRVTLESVWD